MILGEGQDNPLLSPTSTLRLMPTALSCFKRPDAIVMSNICLSSKRPGSPTAIPIDVFFRALYLHGLILASLIDHPGRIRFAADFINFRIISLSGPEITMLPLQGVWFSFPGHLITALFCLKRPSAIVISNICLSSKRPGSQLLSQ